MAACVIDLFEVVQIDEQQCTHPAGLVGHGQAMLQAVEQHAPVGQSGQCIEVGQLMGACFGLLAFSDVAR